MKKAIVFAIAALLAVFVSFGCAKKSEEAAVVNGVKITVEDLEYEIASLPAQYKMMAQSPEMRKRILDNLVIAELLLQEAKKSGILDKEDVQSRIKEQENSLRADAEQQMVALRNQKQNAAAIARREVVIREVLGTQNFADVKVEEKEIRDQYKQYSEGMKRQDPNAQVEKYDQIKEDIRLSIARQKWVDGLRTGAEIKINESVFESANTLLPQGSGIEINR